MVSPGHLHPGAEIDLSGLVVIDNAPAIITLPGRGFIASSHPDASLSPSGQTHDNRHEQYMTLADAKPQLFQREVVKKSMFSVSDIDPGASGPAAPARPPYRRPPV